MILKTGFTVGGYFSAFKTSQQDSLTQDEKCMQDALVQSMEACGISAPNPAVGCVVFKNGRVVAQGFTQEFRKEHAERMALLNFKEDPSECEIFVTLEPCSHRGHQPPCLDLVNKYSWKRVIVAAKDPNKKVDGRSLRQLFEKQNLTVGVLKNECIAWNLPFFYQHTIQRPLIVGKWAESKDGFLADSDGQSKWISNEKSREYVHWLRQKYDAILVGANTFLTDRPLLNVRLKHAKRQPLRLIWDPKNILQSQSQWLNNKDFQQTLQKTLIITNKNLAEHLLSEEFQSKASEALGKPIQSIFVEGGPKTLSHLLENKVIDLLHIFQSKKSLGKSPYKSPLDKNSLSTLNESPHWTILAETSIEEDKLVEALSTPVHKSIFT